LTTPLEPTILKMIVRSVTGASRDHLLDLGAGKRSAIGDRMRARITAIEDKLDKGTAFTLENPPISYNCSHVYSVEYQVMGVSEIAAQLREDLIDSSRVLGFGRPATKAEEHGQG
jgi:hypothetical protein